jgi:hypothetical protein
MAVLEETRARRFTAEEVFRMLEAGILSEDEPLELLEGELVVVRPQDPLHAATASEIEHLLERHGPPDTFARAHSPIAAGPDSMPEPDVALIRGRRLDFAHRHPAAEDLLVVVEICRTSQVVDRDKAATYARAGVPLYWLVDLATRRLHVYSAPRPDGRYDEHQSYSENDRIPVPGTSATLPVRDLLP